MFRSLSLTAALVAAAAFLTLSTSARADDDWVSRAIASEHKSSRHQARERVSSSEERHHERHARAHHHDDDGDEHVSSSSHSGLGPRPSEWCGWYMRSRHGGGPEYNLAANWRHRGQSTSPQVGAIAVWDHHVGEIVGRASNGKWLVLSGNWSGRVATVPRSLSGASIRML